MTVAETAEAIVRTHGSRECHQWVGCHVPRGLGLLCPPCRAEADAITAALDAASASGGAQVATWTDRAWSQHVSDLEARIRELESSLDAERAAGAAAERQRMHAALCKCPIVLVEEGQPGNGDRLGMRREDVSKALHQPDPLTPEEPREETLRAEIEQKDAEIGRLRGFVQGMADEVICDDQPGPPNECFLSSGPFCGQHLFDRHLVVAARALLRSEPPKP